MVKKQTQSPVLSRTEEEPGTGSFEKKITVWSVYLSLYGNTEKQGKRFLRDHTGDQCHHEFVKQLRLLGQILLGLSSGIMIYLVLFQLWLQGRAKDRRTRCGDSGWA
jgi:hypothetical protein